MIAYHPRESDFKPSLYLTIALSSIGLYVVLLLPITGIIGGILFFLVGWAIPSVVNLLIAWWLTTFLPWKIIARLMCLATFSAILAFLPSLSDIIKRIQFHPEFNAVISRKIIIDDNTKIDFWWRPLPTLIADPLFPAVVASGDEGCGCMYWVANSEADFTAQLSHEILKTVGNHVSPIGSTNYTDFPKLLVNGVHFDMQVLQSNKTPGTVDISVDVYDGAQKVASFVERNVLFDAHLKDRTSFWETRLMNGHFWENVFEIMAKDNMWSHFRRNDLSYVPKREIAEFLSQVILRK